MERVTREVVMTIEERYKLSCYEELSQLDDGKMIWLVRHNETGLLYVKKKIQLYNKAVYQQLQKSNITNVPEIIMCVQEEEFLIVIEEYIHGISLEKILERDGSFSEVQTARIIYQLCDTIRILHTSCPPIIHRDIKPSNIMVSNDGVVKLVDFNAAKEFNYGQNEDTRLMGTRKFAAPEQYGFGQSDQRTDIYALGVTMYYLITREFPDSQIYYGKLSPVIQKCVNMDKQRRYQTVDEFMKDLRKFLAANDQQWWQNANREQMSGKKKTNLFTRNLYTYKEKLPVGFRTGVLWKMILAIYGYFGSLWISLTMSVTNSNTERLTGYPLWLNRIAMAAILMGTILFLGNYCGIRYQLPLMNGNKKLHWIFAFIYLLIFYFLVVLLIMFMGAAG